MFLDTRVGFELLGRNSGCNLLGHILPPNLAYVMITTEDVEDLSNRKKNSNTTSYYLFCFETFILNRLVSCKKFI